LVTASVGLYQKEKFGAGPTAPWEKGGINKYKENPSSYFAGLVPLDHVLPSFLASIP